MAANRSLLRRDGTEEAGFTILEVLIAAAILVIAIVLTVTPLVSSMRSLDRSKDVSVAESLAQGKIEQVRALEFSDIGHPGAAPAGIIARTATQTVEGANFRIDTTVEFVGQASGLNIVPQGGDGVEGAFDIGVNYKHVHVVVTPLEGGADPVTMDTFIAPPTVGGLENIAVVEVAVDRHEPFDPGLDPEPGLRLSGPWIYDSTGGGTSQYFADVLAGNYTISLLTSHGWLLHPDSVTTVTATLGVNAQRTIRVYQPVSLDVVVLDDDTSLPITDAVVSATDQTSGTTSTNSAGDYSFAGLVPDRYTVGAGASGYAAGSIDIDVPGPGGGDSATATVRLVAGAFVDYDFDVVFAPGGASGYHINGAEVVVRNLATTEEFRGITDETGHVTISLPADTSGLSVTASTTWGHGSATSALATGSGPGSLSMSLTRPSRTNYLYLYDGAVGSVGFFEYRIGSDPWVRLLANDNGRATFIVPRVNGTNVQIRTYCSDADYPASPEASTTIRLRRRNYPWDAGASC